MGNYQEILKKTIKTPQLNEYIKFFDWDIDGKII